VLLWSRFAVAAVALIVGSLTFAGAPAGAAQARVERTISGCGPNNPKGGFPLNGLYNGVKAIAKRNASYSAIFSSFPHNDDAISLWCIEHVAVFRRNLVWISAEFWSKASKNDVQRFVAFLANTRDYATITVVKHPTYY
jgi:hypothetical protein